MTTQTTAIKVEAIEPGFHSSVLRERGQVFTIASEEEFSSKWMRRVDPDTPITARQQGSRRQQQQGALQPEP
jgi:hypothetical protein